MISITTSLIINNKLIIVVNSNDRIIVTVAFFSGALINIDKIIKSIII